MARLWESDHEYYCNEGNYYATPDKTVFHFRSWSDFIGEMGNADMDYNLLFRWDWSEKTEEGDPTYSGDDYYRNGKLSMFWMGQRKGRFTCTIVDVCRADEPMVVEYLAPRFRYLLDLWAPLAGGGK